MSSIAAIASPSYFCPITHSPMINPVRPSDCRHIFEKAAIERLMLQRDRCPLCEKLITRLVPESALQQTIKQHIIDNNELYENKSYDVIKKECEQHYTEVTCAQKAINQIKKKGPSITLGLGGWLVTKVVDDGIQGVIGFHTFLAGSAIILGSVYYANHGRNALKTCLTGVSIALAGTGVFASAELCPLNTLFALSSLVAYVANDIL